MSSSKKTTSKSKSKKKQPSNLQVTPPSNPPQSIFQVTPPSNPPQSNWGNVYRPQMEDQMFSPTNNQFLANMGFQTCYTNPQFPGQVFTQNAFSQGSQTQTPISSQHGYSQTQTPISSQHGYSETQVDETQFMFSQPRRLSLSESEEEVELGEQQQQQQQQQQEDEAEEGEEEEAATGRAKPQAWTPTEVTTLAQTWIDISEDATKGNDQDLTTFKERVWQLWCVRMKQMYRNPSQLYSKWRNMSKIAKDFEAIHALGVRNWPSGATDADVLEKAKGTYYKKWEKRQPFNIAAEGFWKIIRQSPKWRKMESFHEYAVNTKRSKTSSSTHSQSSDANIGFDMNLEPEELPTGRDKAKRKMIAKGKGKGKEGTSTTTTTTTSAASESLSKLDETIKHLERLKEEEKEQKREERELKKEEHRMKLMEIATRDISGLTGNAYKVAYQAQMEAAKKLGYTIDDE